MCTFVKTHQIIELGSLCFVKCKLYFHEREKESERESTCRIYRFIVSITGEKIGEERRHAEDQISPH